MRADDGILVAGRPTVLFEETEVMGLGGGGGAELSERNIAVASVRYLIPG